MCSNVDGGVIRTENEGDEPTHVLTVQAVTDDP